MVLASQPAFSALKTLVSNNQGSVPCAATHSDKMVHPSQVEHGTISVIRSRGLPPLLALRPSRPQSNIVHDLLLVLYADHSAAIYGPLLTDELLRSHVADPDSCLFIFSMCPLVLLLFQHLQKQQDTQCYPPSYIPRIPRNRQKGSVDMPKQNPVVGNQMTLMLT